MPIFLDYNCVYDIDNKR